MRTETGKERRLAERILQSLVTIFLPHHRQSAPGLRDLGFSSFPSAKWEESEGGHWGKAHRIDYRNKNVCMYIFLRVYTFLIYFFGTVNFENIDIEKCYCHPCLPHSLCCYPHGLLLVTIFISFSYILPIFPYKYLYMSFLFKKKYHRIYTYTLPKSNR